MKSSRQTGLPKFFSSSISLALILGLLAIAPSANATTYMVTYLPTGSTSGTAPVDPNQYSSGSFFTILGSGTLQKNCYDFGGWQNASIPPSQPGQTYPIIANVSLEPWWTPVGGNTYTLTFNGNGNTGGTPPPAIVGCGTITLPGNSGNMTKTGFTFGGWSGNPGGIGSAQPGDPFSLGGNGTLYAIWIPNCNYTLTFNGNGNTTGTPPPAIVGCGTITLPGNSGNMTNPGFTFGGWSGNPGGIGSAQPGDPFSLGGNGTLYAIWIPNCNYTLTFNGNGNTTGTPPPAIVGCGTITLPGNSGNMTKPCFTFAGWSSNPGGIGSAQPGDPFSLGGNGTLFARWTPKTYTLKYNGNGKTSGSVPSPQSGCGAITLRTNSGNLKKFGISAKRWNTQSNQTGSNKSFGLVGFILSSNMTLFAKWY